MAGSDKSPLTPSTTPYATPTPTPNGGQVITAQAAQFYAPGPQIMPNDGKPSAVSNVSYKHSELSSTAADRPPQSSGSVVDESKNQLTESSNPPQCPSALVQVPGKPRPTFPNLQDRWALPAPKSSFIA